MKMPAGKVIITAALNGAFVNKKMNPNVPEQPDEIAQAARERAPHHIARYAHEVAGLFHSFYNHCRVIGVRPELQTARLALAAAVQNTVRSALGILGVTAPDKM